MYRIMGAFVLLVVVVALVLQAYMLVTGRDQLHWHGFCCCGLLPIAWYVFKGPSNARSAQAGVRRGAQPPRTR